MRSVASSERADAASLMPKELKPSSTTNVSTTARAATATTLAVIRLAGARIRGKRTQAPRTHDCPPLVQWGPSPGYCLYNAGNAFGNLAQIWTRTAKVDASSRGNVPLEESLGRGRQRSLPATAFSSRILAQTPLAETFPRGCPRPLKALPLSKAHGPRTEAFGSEKKDFFHVGRPLFRDCKAGGVQKESLSRPKRLSPRKEGLRFEKESFVIPERKAFCSSRKPFSDGSVLFSGVKGLHERAQVFQGEGWLDILPGGTSAHVMCAVEAPAGCGLTAGAEREDVETNIAPTRWAYTFMRPCAGVEALFNRRAAGVY